LLKDLTAIFNSKLAELWIWYNCPELQGRVREIRKVYFVNFPIPPLSDTALIQLVELADRRMQLATDAQLNTAVYALYGLTEAEIDASEACL
jgi:uncharacterized membrane protein YcfT